MAQIAHDRLDIHRDDWLVLDDEHAGTGLLLDLGQRLGDEILDLARLHVDQIGCVLGREAFHRGQQQRLTRQRRHPGEPRTGQPFIAIGIDAVIVQFVIIGRGPDALEHAVQAQAGIDVTRELIRGRDDRLQRGADIFVAVHLAAGQGPAIAPQKGKVGRKLLSKRHG